MTAMLAGRLTAALLLAVSPMTTDTTHAQGRDAEAARSGARPGVPLVIAHRGASGYLPEHTLEAYALAIELGADYVEPDLVATRDGVLIARHEPNLIATTDVAARPEFASRKRTAVVDGVAEEGFFASDFTLAEIKTLRAIQPMADRDPSFNGRFGIPTFSEVLDLVRRKSVEHGRAIGVYPETKHPTYHRDLGLALEDRVLDELARAGMNHRGAPVFIQSFEVSNLQYLRTRTRVKLVQLIDGDSVANDGTVTLAPPFDKPYDIANEADEIKAAFEPYYETTLLSEATDPNLLYEIQTRLAAFPVYTASDVEAFAKVYFDRKATQDRLYAVLAPVVERFGALSQEEQHDFRGQLTDYVRLYAFLAQVLTFADADLEKLYVFARHLRRLLPADREELPREVQQNIDMESYRIQQTGSGRIALDRKPGVLDPVSTKPGHGAAPEELEALSRIIAELNERFGLNLGPEHRVTLGQMMAKLDDDAALDAAARVNTRENVRLTFDQKVEHVIQEIVDSNFELYKRITDDRAFGEAIKNLLFEQYLRARRNAEERIER